MNKITVISNEEFETKFGGDWGYSNCMVYFEGAYASTCRTIEAYKVWKEKGTLDAVLLEAWNICFDTCFDEEGIYYMPQDAYDFYKNAVEVFESEFCDDKEGGLV